MNPANVKLLIFIGAVSAVRIPVPDQGVVDAPSIIASPEARMMIRTPPTLSLISRVCQDVQSADGLPALLSMIHIAGLVEVPEPGGAVPLFLGELVAALVLLPALVAAVLAVGVPVTHLVTAHTPPVITSPSSLARVIVMTVSARKLGHESSVTSVGLTLTGETLSSSQAFVMSPTVGALTARLREEVTPLVRLLALVGVIITLFKTVTNPGARIDLISAHPSPGGQMGGRGGSFAE